MQLPGGDDVRVVKSGDTLPAALRGGAFAIGNFDGVHRGHKELIRIAQHQAIQASQPAGVLTFEPHPRQHFQPQDAHFRLTPLPEKLRLLAGLGVEVAAVATFDDCLASLTPEAFISHVLVDWLGVSHIVVGFNFRFGRKRAGTVETLRTRGADSGFGVSVVGLQGLAGEAFSSSQIRSALMAGDVAAAAQALGHWWRVSGTVEGGHKLGTDLGFPTANIRLDSGFDLAHGIYAVRVVIGDSVHDGAAYYGGRPTVNTGDARLEVFIFDFSGDLYDREISVEFIERVRGDKAFDGLEALKAQMARDCDAARTILRQTGETPGAQV